MATANLTAFAFRFYEDDNADVDSCTAAAAQGATLDRAPDDQFILRYGLNNDASAVYGGTVGLEYNLNGAGWVAVTTSSSVVQAVAGTPTDGANCDADLLTGGSGTFDADGGTYSEDGSASSALAKSCRANWAFALKLVDADVADNDTVTFQFTASANVNQNSVVPTLTVDKGAPVPKSDTDTGSLGELAECEVPLSVVDYAVLASDTDIQTTEGDAEKSDADVFTLASETTLTKFWLGVPHYVTVAVEGRFVL
jgi:hypothetical protein